MINNSENVDEIEELEHNYFEEYYSEHISPLVELDNMTKISYQNRFWTSVWTVISFISVSLLFSLFGKLMWNNPINYGLFVLMAIGGVIIIYWPIYQYRHLEKQNLFGEFINFYGNWVHVADFDLAAVHRPIIPEHDVLDVKHKADGTINDNITVSIRDTIYYKLIHTKKKTIKRKITQGIRLSFRFPLQFQGITYLFEKGGFYKKNTFRDYTLMKDIYVPAAGFFSTFSTDPHWAESFLRSAFFEGALDIKDMFKASKMYIEIKENSLEFFFSDCQLYFDTYKFFGDSEDKEKFITLHRQFEHIFTFVETILSIA